MTHLFGPWGLLPVVAPLFAFVAARLGALAFAGTTARTSDRAVAGVVLAFGATVLAVRLLSSAHAVATGPLVSALVIVAVFVALVDRKARFVLPRVTWVPALLPMTLVLVAAFALAVLAARWLPIWQWDSLGYHLPFVHFTLGARSLDGVPPDLEYIGSYPHDVELFFVALRACLPDDCLVDLGQVPFGLAGAIVTVALARRFGASVHAALACGAAWVAVPAVFLQLPTDYVDVASATFLLAALYFVLAPPTRRTLVLAGVAVGLFVGSKPSAPLPAAVVLTLLAVRAMRAREGRALVPAGLSVALFGAESYAANVVHHANPIWPVQVDVGPIHLHGLHPMSELLAAGAAAPHLTGPLPWRFLRSLVALTSLPSFDMRIGGFGVLFLLALPLALASLARARSLAAWVALLSTLLSPDPAVARYVLAFPALVLALAAAWLGRSDGRPRSGALAFAGVLAGAQLVYALPGISGEGPPLWSYAAMTDAERALAVGADGPPIAVDAARRRVQPGETFAFDENMDLSDTAWDLSQSYRVVFLPRGLGGDALAERLASESVRVLAVGDAAPAGLWALAHPEELERLSSLPSCRKGTCSLFARR